MRDLRQFAHFILRQYDVAPRKVEGTMIERYMAWLYDRGTHLVFSQHGFGQRSGTELTHHYFIFFVAISLDCGCKGRHFFDICNSYDEFFFKRFVLYLLYILILRGL